MTQGGFAHSVAYREAYLPRLGVDAPGPRFERLPPVKSCLSLAMAVLLLLSHLAVVVGVIFVATDLTSVGRWGILEGTLVFAILVTVVFRMLGHRVWEAYDVLSIFSW